LRRFFASELGYGLLFSVSCWVRFGNTRFSLASLPEEVFGDEGPPQTQFSFWRG
jgi:hypothetical protein